MQLNGFKYSKRLNSSFLPIDGTLTGTFNSSWPGSNGYEGVLHIPLNSIIRASPSDSVYFHAQGTHCEVLPLRRDAVGVFNSPNRQYEKKKREREKNQLIDR